MSRLSHKGKCCYLAGAMLLAVMTGSTIPCAAQTLTPDHAVRLENNVDIVSKAAAEENGPASDIGQELIQSLRKHGTPEINYKISEAEPDVVIDAVAYVSSTAAR